MSGPMHAPIGLIHAEARRGDEPWRRHAGEHKLPFITIAREVGAGGDELAERLALKLNETIGERPRWRSYDRDLVEQIARDHHLSSSLVDLLESAPHGWFQDILASLDFTRPSEQTLTRRVVETIRALAEAGHAVIVGRGGVFITRAMATGIHVHLVAPFNHRVERYAEQFRLIGADAARRVREIDLNRAQFYARHFPRTPLEPSLFDLTINTARVPTDAAIRMITALVPVTDRVPVRIDLHQA